MDGFRGVAMCVLVVTAAGCGPKKVGDACAPTEALVCDGTGAVLACVSSALASVPCEGPKGCSDSASGTFCDVTVGVTGRACPPWAEGNTVCQPSPSALLKCIAGKWATLSSCSSCSTSTGAAVCVPPTVDPGDGGTECSPATCPNGCCGSTGICMTARSANACGTGGAACAVCGSGKTCDATFQCVTGTSGCSPATCADGCCSNGACIRPPDSPSNTACGPLGGSCTDCAAQGLLCNLSSRTCAVSPTDGGSDGGDPCQGVPVGGECLTSTVVRFCAVSSGPGDNSIKTYACTGSATCQATATAASCVSSGSSCVPFDTRCSSIAQLQSCTPNGTWSAATDCAPGACVTGPVGAYCTAGGETVTVTGTLLYQGRNPVRHPGGLIDDDWGPPVTMPGRNVVVASLTAVGTSNQTVDETTTNAQGQFTIKVLKTRGPDDVLTFNATNGDGRGVRYAVADPNFGMGSFQPGQTVSNPRLWSWSKSLAGYTTGSTITLSAAQGSGAMNVFDVMQNAWVTDAALHHGRNGSDVILWFGLGTQWSCGSCFLGYPGSGFQTQVFVGGDATDQPYWGRAMLAHEIGHWALSSYSVSPGEGGAHYAGLKTYPGQAWDEGFATFHSSALRDDSVYFDRQGQGMFWFDLSARSYYPGSAFETLIVRTKADGGMLQQVDENDVAAMLLQIANSAPSGVARVHDALASEHQTTSPWPQGYTRHTWSVDVHGTKTDVVDTKVPAPHFGDLLDALRCDGMPASFIDPATSPATLYPFNSDAPKCRPGFCYGCTSSNNQCLSGLSNAACGAGGNACSVCAPGASCSNGVCQ